MGEWYKKFIYVFTKEYRDRVALLTYLEKEVKKPDSKLRLKGSGGPDLKHIIEYSKDNPMPKFRIPINYETESDKGQEPGE